MLLIEVMQTDIDDANISPAYCPLVRAICRKLSLPLGAVGVGRHTVFLTPERFCKLPEEASDFTYRFDKNLEPLEPFSFYIPLEP